MSKYIIDIVTRETKKVVIENVKGISEDIFAQYIAGTKKIDNVKKSVTVEIISIDGKKLRDKNVLIGKRNNELTSKEKKFMADLEITACDKCKIIYDIYDVIWLDNDSSHCLSQRKLNSLRKKGYWVLCKNCCK